MNKYARSAAARLMAFILVCLVGHSSAEDESPTEKALREIIIPKIEFEEATVEEALEFLRASAKQHGVPFPGVVAWQEPRGVAEAFDPITLRLDNVPLGDALNYTLELAGGYSYQVRGNRIVIGRNLGVAPALLITRTFAVPHNFLELASFQGGEPSAEDDPFGGEGEREGCRLWPVSEVQLLEEVGIPFPDGASAVLDKQTRQLVVRNTQPCLELVGRFVDLIWERVPEVIYLRAEIYLLDKPVAAELLDQAAESEQDVAAQLRTLAREGRAELADLLGVATSLGETAVCSSGSEFEFIGEYVSKSNRDIPVRNSVFVGTQLEASVSQETEHAELQVEVALSKTFGEPELIDSQVPGPVSGELLPVKSVRVSQGGLRTKTRLVSGQARVLGSFSPNAESGGAGNKQTCIVILKARSKKVGRR